MHILNVSSNRASTTALNGDFSIAAKIGDTLIISAVQFKKKELLISLAVLASMPITITMESEITQLDEVIVLPYNLTGNLSTDANDLTKEPVYTTSTLGLPNAYVKPLTQAENRLYEATTGAGIPLNPIINAISGRTNKLKKLVAYEKSDRLWESVRNAYSDSTYVKELKISQDRLDDFIYYCETDTKFSALAKNNNPFQILSFLKGKIPVYKKNNGLK